jgi:hypothetical protein
VTATTVAELLSEVPEQHITYLQKSGEDVSRAAWSWGTIANKWIKMGKPSMLTYSAIGLLVGKRQTTIRVAAYVDRRFDGAIREEYGILSFGHFVVALIYKGDPIDVLHYAVSVADEKGGRPASVDEVRFVFGIKGNTPKMPKEAPNGHQSFRRPDFEGWTIPAFRRLSQVLDPKERYYLEQSFMRLARRIGS